VAWSLTSDRVLGQRIEAQICGGVGEPGAAVDLFFFGFGFEEDQADALGVGSPGEVGAERGGDASWAERGQDRDGGEFADGDGDEAAALGQAGQSGDVVRAGRPGQLVSVVLDGGGVRHVGFADGLADGDPGW
jgi:hypothetical protein